MLYWVSQKIVLTFADISRVEKLKWMQGSEKKKDNKVQIYILF